MPGISTRVRGMGGNWREGWKKKNGGKVSEQVQIEIERGPSDVVRFVQKNKKLLRTMLRTLNKNGHSGEVAERRKKEVRGKSVDEGGGR